MSKKSSTYLGVSIGFGQRTQIALRRGAGGGGWGVCSLQARAYDDCIHQNISLTLAVLFVYTCNVYRAM